jgi:glycosyltransferase involved in cell wall biosynthesis
MSRVAPIRVLQVVGGMNPGGVETWLLHVLRQIDRERIRLDFLVHTRKPCVYDEDVRALGSAIIPCTRSSRPLEYARNFRRIMCEHGPYDVIHSHVHHFSGYVLSLARQAGVRIRIAHSHNDTSVVEKGSTPVRRAYFALMRHWIERHATLGLAASRQAGDALFGQSWRLQPGRATLYCGVDLSRFETTYDRAAVRAELGIPADALVVGHVGRFDPQKNHTFLIDVAAEMARREPRVVLLLVGDGRLRPAIELKVKQLGLERCVVFAGLRQDVPRIMLGAIDAFLMPSSHEGLPLVLMEAQAAGLQCVISDTISDETDRVIAHIRRLSLQAPASVWADCVLSALYAGPSVPRREALAIMERSPFSVKVSIEQLETCYGA